MRPDRGRLSRASTGGCLWRSDDGRARATWAAPHRTAGSGLRITTAVLRTNATVTTPAAVLMAVLTASTLENAQEAKA